MRRKLLRENNKNLHPHRQGGQNSNTVCSFIVKSSVNRNPHLLSYLRLAKKTQGDSHTGGGSKKRLQKQSGFGKRFSLESSGLFLFSSIAA
jgi:hypothetical protein